MTSGTRPGGGGRTTVDDREKPSRAKPDERCSSPSAKKTFDAEAPATRCSRRRTRVATNAARRSSRPCRSATTIQSNRALETALYAEENTWVSTWTGEQLVETMQALDEPRHHTAKTVCVRRSRGETDALANSDAGRASTAQARQTG